MGTHTLLRAAPTRRRQTVLVVAALTVVAALLRGWGLGDKSLWIDEAFSLWISVQDLDAIWRHTAVLDKHPPLYYALLHLWLGPDAGEIALRGFSVLFGVATVPLAYVIGRDTGGRWVGLLAAALLAVSPLHIALSQLGRMYTMLTFFAALSTCCLVRLLTRGSTLRRGAAVGCWVGFAGGLTLTMLAHNTAVLYPVAVAVFLAVAALQRTRARAGADPDDTDPDDTDPVVADPVVAVTAVTDPVVADPGAPDATAGDVTVPHPLARDVSAPDDDAQHTRTVPPYRTRHYLLALAAGLLAWSPWLPGFRHQAGAVDTEFWLPPPTLDTVLDHVRSLGSARAPGELLVVLAVAFVVLAGLGAWRLRGQTGVAVALVALVAVPVLGELAVSLRRPIFYSQTLAWTVVPFLVLVAAGLLQLRHRALVAAATGALLALNAVSLATYYAAPGVEDWRGAARHVAENAAPGELVLFNAAWTRLPFDFYYRSGDGAALEPHGVPTELFERGELESKVAPTDLGRVDALVAGRSRVWVVYSHDWYTDPSRLVENRLAATLRRIDERAFGSIRIVAYARR